MLERYGRFVFRFRVLFLVIGLAAMLGGGIYAGGVYDSLTQGGFVVPGSQSEQADTIINEHLGGNRTSLIVLFTSRSLSVDDPAFKTAANKSLDWLGRQAEVSSLSSYYSIGDKELISHDRHSTYALVGLKGNDDQQANAVARLRPHLKAPPLAVSLGGAAAVNYESTDYVKKDLSSAERVTFPITALLLVVIFGSLAAASLPLALGLFGVIGALVITRLVAHATDMSVYVLNLISLLGLGLAIDYSLFIVSRFREELTNCDNDTATALGRTVATAGRTIIFSALTVLVALAGLIIFPIGFLRSMGIGGAAAVLVALLGTLTFLPAILALLEKNVNALRVSNLVPKRILKGSRRVGNWERITRVVMRRPLIIVLATLTLLLVAGSPFLQVHFINPDYHVLPAASQARQVGDAVTHDFSANTEAPIQVVVRTKGPPATAPNLSLLDTYGRELQDLPGVKSIENPAEVVGASGAQLYSALQALQNNPTAQAALDQYANGNYVLLNILPVGGTYDPATKQLVKNIRAVPVPKGLQVLVGGQTADLVDLLALINHDGVYALIVVLGAMLILFFLLLGSVVIPLKTIILNVLSLSAAFGALVWIFQQGHLSGWLGITPESGIDATQPVIIFALAFGLSMDYAIFLFSRIKERYDEKPESMKAAIGWGVQRTGGIITSAAVLLLVVIGAFAMGRIVVMKEVAIGLIVAVVVDVFVVRLLLVPASMCLLGKYNWWAPKPLQKLHARSGLKH